MCVMPAEYRPMVPPLMYEADAVESYRIPPGWTIPLTLGLLKFESKTAISKALLGAMPPDQFAPVAQFTPIVGFQ